MVSKYNQNMVFFLGLRHSNGRIKKPCAAEASLLPFAEGLPLFQWNIRIDDRFADAI